MRIFLSLSFLASVCFIASEASARDLTYKIGVGYRQAYTNAIVNDKTNAYTSAQINGIEATYGIARDLQAGAYFGFTGNFDFGMVGPKIRYDLERLISRDSAVWSHLNIFTEASFYAKFGRTSKSGFLIEAPAVGFEVLPLAGTNFAILTSAGLVMDFVNKTRIGFTQGMLGNLGVKYYF